MVNPPEITRSSLEADPELLWNTFVNFLSEADTTLMNDVQMAAQLPFWYDCEIQNGGHLQYFESKYRQMGDKLNVLILATLDALKIIGANQQAEILARAADIYFSRPRGYNPETGECAESASNFEFEGLDNEYYSCSPETAEFLERYLNAHTDNFIKIV